MAGPEFELFTSLRYDPALLELPVGAEARGSVKAWNLSKPSPLYMLDLHRDRMLRAATYFGWTDAEAAIAGDDGLARLEAYILGLPEVGNHPLRVKVTISKSGTFGYEVGQVPATTPANLFPPRLPPPGEQEDQVIVPKEPAYRVVVDHEPTPASEFTHYKTTKRDMYDGARQRAALSPTDRAEILLVNSADGSIMEGSLTTPYFWRNGQWVTPPIPAQFAQGSGSGGQDGTSRRWALESGLCAEESVLASTLVEGEECWISNGVRGFNCGRVSLV